MDRKPDVHAPSRLGWTTLRILLLIELVGGAVVLWNVVLAFIAANDEPLGSRLSLLLAVVISWAWIGITLWGALTHRASWVRGSALTIHILMFPAATGVLQGILGAAAPLGWALLGLAVLGVISAVLARPVPANENAGEASS